MTPEMIAAIVVAALSGGTLVKLADLLLNRGANERTNLREDITHLRAEIAELRVRITALETENTLQKERLARWQRAYWQLRTYADRLVDYLSVTPRILHADDHLAQLVSRYQDMELADSEDG